MLDQLDNPYSRIDRVKHVGRQTVTELAIVDDLIVHRCATDGGLVLEFVRYGADGRVRESFRVTLCQDVARVRGA